jgi:SecD/SecF fusion protein
LFTVASLFLFGGSSIHDFSLALLIGLVVGTYSSIFVASPLLSVWRNNS